VKAGSYTVYILQPLQVMNIKKERAAEHREKMLSEAKCSLKPSR
jgi:hypothetical protein